MERDVWLGGEDIAHFGWLVPATIILRLKVCFLLCAAVKFHLWTQQSSVLSHYAILAGLMVSNQVDLSSKYCAVLQYDNKLEWVFRWSQEGTQRQKNSFTTLLWGSYSFMGVENVGNNAVRTGLLSPHSNHLTSEHLHLVEWHNFNLMFVCFFSNPQ